MQILSVELENVKSYAQARVEFSRGVNAIVGHNGAGKSTILEAIGFVLFDALNYNQADFIRGGMKHATAAVTFLSSEDERPYTVQRRIGTAAHYTVLDPELDAKICDGKADVQRFLRRHLQMENGADFTSLFKDAVGVPQGTLTAAFLLGAPDRKRIFDALLRVEEYDKAQVRLREPQGVLKARRATVAQEISRLQGRMERLPGLEAEAKLRHADIEACRQELTVLLKEFEQVQTQRIQLDQARDAVVAAERALHAGDQKLQASKGRLAVAQQGRADAETARDLVTKHKPSYDAYVAAEAEQKTIDVDIRRRGQIESQRAAADRKLAQLEAEAKNVEQELAKVAEAERTAVVLQPDVERQIELEKALEEARRQQVRLDDVNRRAAQIQEQINRGEVRLRELTKQLAEAGALESQIADAQEAVAAGRVGLDAKRAFQVGLQSQAELIKAQSDRLQDVTTAVCPVCEQPLQDTHRRDLLARNNARLDAMRQEYREAGAEVKRLEEQVQAQDARVQQLQRKLLQLPRAEERTKLDEELARLRSDLAETQAAAAELATAAGQAAGLGRELEKLGDPRRRYTVAAEQARRRAALETQQAASRQTLQEVAAQVATFQAQLAEFGDLDAAADAVARRLREHREGYQTVLAHQRQAAGLEARLADEAMFAAEVDAHQTAHADLDATYRAAAAKFNAQEHAAAVARERELQGKVGSVRGQLSTLETTQHQAETEIAELRALTAVVEEAEQRMRRLENEEEVLDTIRTMLRQAGPYITNTLIRQISDGARDIFSDLMQDYSRHLCWNEDYSITLEVEGRTRSFSQLSGGEQMSAALAVRLALLREMSSIDVAFFDEPTVNLDEERREALARQITHVRGFQQLFVISHDDTFEQATQNLIRVDRVDGVSRVVRGGARA